MAIFPELIMMLLGAFCVIAQEVDTETDHGAKGYEEEKIPPHIDTSLLCYAHRMQGYEADPCIKHCA